MASIFVRGLAIGTVIVVVAIASGHAQDEFPDYYTPEQKVRMKKFMAEMSESMAKMTDKERNEVNSFLKGMHELCAAAEKKLLYEVDHAAIARDARQFGASQDWASSAPDKRIRFDRNSPALPASIRALNPSSVWVSVDRVHIELGGAMQHQGLTVFREPNGGTGTVQVGKGIWYTSENNRRFIGQPPPTVSKQ